MLWIFPEQKKLGLVDYIYSTRNIKNQELFFNPNSTHLQSPLLIHDAEVASKAILKAIDEKKKIYIHGDFDVDGITATSILWSFLYKDLGADVLPHIPNRFTDGYGLSEETIERIIADGGNLIISVDCGVKDIELVNKYSDKIDFIITDHHTIRSLEEPLPEGSKIVGEHIISSKALAVVHPKLNNNLAFNEYCGAVVSWKLCCAINEIGNKSINMLKYIDLAALGTVCDVMPLVDENRTIVKLGLAQLSQTENIGLKSLCNVSKIDLTSLDAYHLGFIIGPRLNASGRLESAMDAVRLLTTSNKDYAKELASKLDRLNKERQDLTRKYLEIAEEKLEANKINFIVGDEWPEGIIGLIAGKLTEKYHKPFIIGSRNGDSIKASARSPEYFHIANALKQLDSHLERHGGHAQAAGLTINSSNFDSFYSALQDIANTEVKDEDLIKKVKLDAIANKDEINEYNAKALLSLSPFGMHNPKPLIGLKGIDMKNFRTMGADGTHLKIPMHEDGFDIVAFNMANEILDSDTTLFDFAGNLDLDSWNGRNKPTFKVQYFRPAE